MATKGAGWKGAAKCAICASFVMCRGSWVLAGIMSYAKIKGVENTVVYAFCECCCCNCSDCWCCQIEVVTEDCWVLSIKKQAFWWNCSSNWLQLCYCGYKMVLWTRCGGKLDCNRTEFGNVQSLSSGTGSECEPWYVAECCSRRNNKPIELWVNSRACMVMGWSVRKRFISCKKTAISTFANVEMLSESVEVCLRVLIIMEGCQIRKRILEFCDSLRKEFNNCLYYWKRLIYLKIFCRVFRVWLLRSSSRRKQSWTICILL